MKTKNQILHFLKQRKFKSQMDFDGISLYCREKYSIRLHNPSSFSSEPTALDYATFAQWLNNGFAAGDVVFWGENIGLIQDADLTTAKICLKIDRNGPSFDSFTIPVQDITLAEKSASERVFDTLSKKGLEFGNPHFLISEKFIPASCNLVTFQNHKTGQSGFGVVRNVNSKGEIIMYCYCVKNMPPKYSMNEYLGMIDDFSFSAFTPADYTRKALDIELAKVGKTWNHYLKRIEPLNMRVKKGERYWYITDKMQVTSDVEKGTATSNKRYLCANYFRNQEDAIRIQSEEMELRRNLLAEPNKQ